MDSAEAEMQNPPSGEADMQQDDDEEDSSSSDSEDETTRQLEAKVNSNPYAMLLPHEQVNSNPYDYNSHVELIRALRREGELVEVRLARERMSKFFPLTEELWMDWLTDEMKLDSGRQNRAEINKLFERAVKDYLCVDVWLEYIQYCIGGMEDGLESVRAVCEKALTAGGLHVSKGTMLWDVYREFENAVLAGMQPDPGSICTGDQEEKIQAQITRINSIFRRQLSVPLLGMDGTYLEYEEFQTGPVDATVKQAYQKACEKLEKYKPYEESLISAAAPRLQEYLSYIDYELAEDEPTRIQCIFERALQENPLVVELWTKYTHYLDTKLRIPNIVLSAHERATRNCPWAAALWQGYLLALERHRQPREKIKEVMDTALPAGFPQASDYVSLWQTYCDYHRRRVDWTKDAESSGVAELRSTYQQAVEYCKDSLQQYFGETGDPQCTFKKSWARIEAKYCKDMGKARELWDGIMAEGHGREAQMWLEYADLERSFGDVERSRKVLQKAVSKASDWPESVCEALINFEREEGTLETYDNAVARCEAQLKRVQERRAKQAEKELVAAQAEAALAEARKKNKADKKAAKKQEMKQGQKRKLDHQLFVKSGDTLHTVGSSVDEEGFKVPSMPAPKTGKAPEEPPVKRAKGDEAEEVSFSAAWQSIHEATIPPVPSPTATSTGDPHVPDPDRERRSVFVSNLNYNLHNPQDKMKEIFSECGEVADVRLAFTSKRKFRGFCYVEFKDESAAVKALGFDHKEVEGRPLFVSPCIDKRKGDKFHGFQYATKLEKNKLFVSNLPFTVTKEALENIFKEHGPVRGVRLVTYRSGKPKGLAYVEYEDEQTASQAVLKTDGLMIGDRKIQVAVSNPPTRRGGPHGEGVDDRLRSDTSKESQYRGKARTQLSLLPRSLHKPSTTSASTSKPPAGSNGTTTDQPTSTTTQEPLKQGAKRLTNADFAKMFFKK
ncbi:Squamous cell carcinoma antigen recognized by T-cells 3 [Branchiostoma belcheri]|nr:Squamous cell carcinoma antigen recognized by T-cells 3 [Branchiostoma belcheri]